MKAKISSWKQHWKKIVCICHQGVSAQERWEKLVWQKGYHAGPGDLLAKKMQMSLVQSQESVWGSFTSNQSIRDLRTEVNTDPEDNGMQQSFWKSCLWNRNCPRVCFSEYCIYGIHEKRKEYNPFILTCSSLIFVICYLQIFQDLGGSVPGGLSLWKGQSGFTPSWPGCVSSCIDTND